VTENTEAEKKAPKDLNIPDPSLPCVSLPEMVVIRCPLACDYPKNCTVCDGYGSILVDKARLRVMP
jgi:hypothetical protein